jgi:hypothetical protein
MAPCWKYPGLVLAVVCVCEDGNVVMIYSIEKRDILEYNSV